ncbi:MAG TPA: LysR family transcriptional regulator [Verrucomicrobiae bacterium]|jgi:DNA-binding transcriptional LysR family regulator|nr:LysR family transcriptional regulator [Verrucomicrobiae bacterium]
MFAELLQQRGLSLDRLQSFCLVAQAGGVTKAAKGDAARQSLFSRQINELEEFFGTELIRRKGRGIVLTETGERLNVVARECFASLLDFKRECTNQPAEVVIGTGESVIQWLLMPRLDQIRERMPNVRLKFLNLPTEETVKQLSDGLIDFALVRKDAVARPLQAKTVGVMGYSLFVPCNLHAADNKKDNLKILDGLPLATLEGEGSFRSALANFARKRGIQVNVQVECPSFPLAARAVARGKVAAILPSIAATDLQANGAKQVAVTFLKEFDREMCLATNPRLIRIRPVLEKVAAVLLQVCLF